MADKKNIVHVSDPSLKLGNKLYFGKNKTLFRKLKSIAKLIFIKVTRVRQQWGCPLSRKRKDIEYYWYSAEDLKLPSSLLKGLSLCLNKIESDK